MNESPIFTKTYDLMLWLTSTLTKFPKEHRFRLAARIEYVMFQLHDVLLRASYAHQKAPYLMEADLELEKLRRYLRLAMDTRCISFNQYEHAAKLVNEIGRLLGGWQKSIKASRAGESSAESGEGLLAGRVLEQ